MTTKVTDTDVLALISSEPISQIELGRKLGIHRSNVTPHLKRLEAAGQVKQTTDGKWILAQAQSGTVLRATTLSEKQLRLAEKLFDTIDEYPLDRSADIISEILELCTDWDDVTCHEGLSQKQLEFCRKLLNVTEVDDYELISDSDIDGSENNMLYLIMKNLTEMYPHNNLVENFAQLTQYVLFRLEGFSEPDPDLALEKILNSLREDIHKEIS